MKNKCLVPACENPQVSRGLCMGCFVLYRRYVRDGLTSEKEAMAAGLLLPKRSPPGRAIGQSKFGNALEKTRKEKRK